MAYAADERLQAFIEKTRDAQVSLLIGSHFSDLATLVAHYLPKPALDYISGRMTELLKHRPGDPKVSDPPAASPPASSMGAV